MPLAGRGTPCQWRKSGKSVRFGGRVTAWRPAIQGAELDSNPPPTHPPPLSPPSPPFLPLLPRGLLTPLVRLVQVHRFGDHAGGSARPNLRVRERSRRLRTSTARAARVGVSRAGSRGGGAERRGRDCDFVLSGRGLSGALESDSDTVCDVCDASLYKNSIVPASNDT